jgi:hypothetical protein
MVNAINSYHEDAWPGLGGPAVLWRVAQPVFGEVVRLREVCSALVEPRPTNLSSVTCNLSFLLCGLLT